MFFKCDQVLIFIYTYSSIYVIAGVYNPIFIHFYTSSCHGLCASNCGLCATTTFPCDCWCNTAVYFCGPKENYSWDGTCWAYNSSISAFMHCVPTSDPDVTSLVILYALLGVTALVVVLAISVCLFRYVKRHKIWSKVSNMYVSVNNQDMGANHGWSFGLTTVNEDSNGISQYETTSF